MSLKDLMILIASVIKMEQHCEYYFFNVSILYSLSLQPHFVMEFVLDMRLVAKFRP